MFGSVQICDFKKWKFLKQNYVSVLPILLILTLVQTISKANYVFSRFSQKTCFRDLLTFSQKYKSQILFYKVSLQQALLIELLWLSWSFPAILSYAIGHENWFGNSYGKGKPGKINFECDERKCKFHKKILDSKWYQYLKKKNFINIFNPIFETSNSETTSISII